MQVSPIYNGTSSMISIAFQCGSLLYLVARRNTTDRLSHAHLPDQPVHTRKNAIVPFVSVHFCGTGVSDGNVQAKGMSFSFCFYPIVSYLEAKRWLGPLALIHILI